VKHAIRKHLRDFIAVLALVAVGVGVGGYLLANQRLRFPIIEEEPFSVWIELENAQAVTPGQGQTVRVSGMRIGDIGTVELHEGKARVRLDIDQKYDDLVRRDATALLRPRTGLKDMFLALDPGSPSEPALPEGGVIRAASTGSDVNPDEILGTLDRDTRDYLKLLINGAGKGLEGRGGDLREVFRRLGPLHRDLSRLNRLVATRRENLARLIHNYGSTIQRLGREDRELATLVTSSRRVFTSLAAQDAEISQAIERLPDALAQTEATLRRVNELGQTAGPAFEALRPAVRELDAANAELRPLATEIEPVLRERIRPFVRDARPYIRDLRPAARDLAEASPDLRESFFELNRFFNIGAFNPNGAEPLTGDLQRDTAREEGLLFWLAWVAKNSNSLFATGDAQGPIRRFVALASCSTYRGLVQEPGGAALVEELLGVGDLLADNGLCPS
jgi:phospholipid/cholesterol/gamma-HCH transport system substrate-binding protein